MLNHAGLAVSFPKRAFLGASRRTLSWTMVIHMYGYLANCGLCREIKS